MPIQTAVEIARLVQACGEIKGRVKLQKMVHILQEAGHPFDLKFDLHYHGPYCSDLVREVEQLVRWKHVDERPEPAGPDYVRYKFTPKESLPETLQKCGVQEEPVWKALASQLNEKPWRTLEGISTIMYLRKLGFDEERLEQRFKALKPHLKDQFKEFFSFADEHQKMPVSS